LKPSEKKYKRIVIKIGSSLLCTGDKGINSGLVGEITAELASLLNEKKEVVLVSSGAIALGMHALKLSQRPKELSLLQSASATGQNLLMNVYATSFKERGLTIAQVLLTWEDFNDRRRYLNAKNTLLTLLKLGVVPIINENDTVSTDEIKFGDNDRLSALVASLISADLLIILSDVDGLLAKDKKTIVRVVSEINAKIKALACPTDKKTSVGGMITKLEAAKIAVDSGIPCVIANGKKQGTILANVKDPGKTGTLFVSKKSYLAAKKRWIAFGSRPKGKIIVDEGAKRALLNKKSLLAVGIVATEGVFENADIVSIVGKDNFEFARGKVSLASRQLENIKGARFAKEVIHSDNIVIL